MHPWHWHPTERAGDDLTFEERVADWAVKAMGSLRFISAMTVAIVIWVVVNLVAVEFRWDPYPFILLNLAFSVQAAYAAPLMLMASRRGDQRNSERSQHDFEADSETLQLTREIHARIVKEPNT